MNTAQWPSSMTPLHKCACNKPQRDIIVPDQAIHTVSCKMLPPGFFTKVIPHGPLFHLIGTLDIYIKKNLPGNCYEIPWFCLILQMLSPIDRGFYVRLQFDDLSWHLPDKLRWAGVSAMMQSIVEQLIVSLFCADEMPHCPKRVAPDARDLGFYKCALIE